MHRIRGSVYIRSGVPRKQLKNIPRQRGLQHNDYYVVNLSNAMGFIKQKYEYRKGKFIEYTVFNYLIYFGSSELTVKGKGG